MILQSVAQCAHLITNPIPRLLVNPIYHCYVACSYGYDSFFIRFNSVSESFDLTQLIGHNGFTRIDSNQLKIEDGFLKFD